MKYIVCCFIYLILSKSEAQCFSCKNAPSGTIFCDDFDDSISLDKKYFEINNNDGDFVKMKHIGRDSSYGMRVKWQQGEVSAGGLSKSFGRTPDSYIGRNSSMPTTDFDEIYWRMDVRAQKNWIGGGPAKLTRAMCLANSNWAQGMMAHLWSGGANDHFLGMDPASGIGLDGKLKSTKYNDFSNLRWLGFKAGTIDLFSSENADRWFCVVGHVKLNTPDKKDGIFEFWINDTLQASSQNLDWHSSWNRDAKNMHINAIFFENYWNAGSPVEQERYFDNLIISVKPIECKCLSTKTIESTYSIKFEVQISENSIVIKTKNLNNQFQFTILDIQGRVIQTEILHEETKVIDTSNWLKGIYFLIIPETNFRQKIIVI